MTITLNTNTEKHHHSFQSNAQTRVAFHHVHKSFVVNQQPVKVIHDFNLEIKEGEFIAIVGSSGCGKSTLLRLLAGLDQDFDGRILIDGADVSGIGGDRAVVFQEHRLFPWLTVEQNIELGLLNEALTARDKDILVQKAIELIGLNGFEKAYPHQLSGGMSQRVAIARSLVVQPRIFLLDEPFGALDALTRHQMQNELLRIQSQQKMTTVFITHDVEEAVTLADRVVILKPKPGRVEQIIPINLPRPRNRSSFELHQLKEQIFRILTEDKIG
ncbi:ABC transporter ATP-binding protein [Acinetobacter sp. AOR15_HL]|uniref:ABC transporter ATP-binding protein n=1 Tax=unclassified Acinetobacter TaxID=196816 RepID=UPI0022EAED42|nr:MULTISPECIES: ABC transporter ATP-binding protein [unclassified Acinetobacter]MDA3557747.1 ABC transporter ATP-binding protein [Acinetobacter sp. AOR15_HL]MDA3570910.1 ABC transporter ATP-binding protein [Acinetobacter sp. AOR14_HL]MDS7930978.1 ABC transporter ATP-binding protein [Acinetobacter sp. V102_4]